MPCFAIEASDQAVKQSGLDMKKEDPTRCGTIVGSGIGGLGAITDDSVKMHIGGARRVSPMMIPKGLANMASGVVAIRHGFSRAEQGGCYPPVAAGSHSIGDAADLIRVGKADVMLAGGAEATVIPFGIAGFLLR